MKKISGNEQAIEPGDSLNVWYVSQPDVQIFAGTARPMPDLVDYRFVNGWVATGDLPCREALRAILPDRQFCLSDAPEMPQLYVGGEDPNVDFSTFRPGPELISRWMRSAIWSDQAQDIEFEVETCGSIRIWVGEDEAAALAFEPYDRNIGHRKRFTVTVPAGEVTLHMRLEDMHERDTSCYARLTVISGTGLSVPSDNPGIRRACEVLNGLRTDRLFYRNGQIRVLTDAPLDSPVEISLLADENDRSTMNVLPESVSAGSDFILSETGQAVPILDITDCVPGCVILRFQVMVDGVAVRRDIGTTVMPALGRIDAPGLTQRKQMALDLIAADGGRGPSRALALLACGKVDLAADILDQNLGPIEKRFDCADFFILPILRIWRDYRDLLPAALQARMKAAILGFRYWTDEPGNDVMWFWSENHVLCFHAAQYVAGDLFPDEVFDASQRTGAAQRDLAHRRLMRWFASAEAHGFAEWNSAAYYPIDLIGLLTLVDMSPDAEIGDRAAVLCDLIFAMVALHTIGGACVGTQGRAYERELFAGPATELATTAAVAFGGPWVRGYERAASLLALSSYAPPRSVRELTEIAPGRQITASYVQGLDANAKLNLWKSDAALLSSVAEHKTGAIGHQQHVVDLVFRADPFARIWVNHPGDLKPWGGSRPSLWAGSGVVPRVAQQDNVALLVFDLDRQKHPIGFTHALLPSEVLDEQHVDGHWLFARAGDGYAALWCSTKPVCNPSGLYAGSEWRAEARQAGWVMVAGCASVHQNFESFRAAARALEPAFDRDSLTLSTRNHALAFDGDWSVDGQVLPFAPLSIIPHVRFDHDPDFSPILEGSTL